MQEQATKPGIIVDQHKAGTKEKTSMKLRMFDTKPAQWVKR